jgi:hypothetical protein
MSAKPINTIALRTSCVLKIHLQPLTGSLPVAAAIPSKAGIEDSPAKLGRDWALSIVNRVVYSVKLTS